MGFMALNYVNQTCVFWGQKMIEMTSKTSKMTLENWKNDSCVYVDNSVDCVDFSKKTL